MNEPTLDASVVIPTYNRRDVLLKTLAALARIDYPRQRWEVIVVDDGSPDPGMAEVEAWAGRCEAPIRYLRVPNGGPARARNHGAALARGRTLVFLDNDIEVRPDFLRLHIETGAAHPACWVVGRIRHPPELRLTPFGRYRDALHESSCRQYPGDRVSPFEEGLTAANLSLPAHDFRRLGGFQECFTIASGEDSELGMRARAAGIRVVYNPLIDGLHNDWADTLKSYCDRVRSYSRSDVLFWRLHGESCPRARLVRESSPVDWRTDSAGRVVKKGGKRLASSPPAARLVDWLCRVTEAVAPDSALSHRAYNLAIGRAIFRGVREGWEEYVVRPGRAGSSALTPDGLRAIGDGAAAHAVGAAAGGRPGPAG